MSDKIKILAIESSCDETAAAVVEDGRCVKSNIISSQIELHKLYGGVVPEIASRKHVEKVNFVVREALKEANPIEEMDENTQVSLDIDFEKLYYNMVGCRAEWLYNLKEWDDILTEERRKELYKESRNSTTVVKGKKIGRNDPCPCGSGKKYKKCCGKNA